MSNAIYCKWYTHEGIANKNRPIKKCCLAEYTETSGNNGSQ